MKVRGFIDARSIGLVLIKDVGNKASPLRGLKELQPIQKQISSLGVLRHCWFFKKKSQSGGWQMGSGECLLATLEVSEVRPQLRRSWVTFPKSHLQRHSGTTPSQRIAHQSGWSWDITCWPSWSSLGWQQQSSGAGLVRTSLSNQFKASQALLLLGRISAPGWTMPSRSPVALKASKADASRLQH